MSTDKNQRDIDLLKKNPSGLLTKYQSVIEAVVTGFINRGFFERSEKMEVVQTINAQLLEVKLQRMQEQFNGSVYLSTYFSKVVYNACQEIIRQQKRKPNTLNEDHLMNVSEKKLDAHQRMVLEDELRRFEGILQTFHHKKPKVDICFRLMAKSILSEAALGPYHLIGDAAVIKKIKNNYFEPYDSKHEKDIYSDFVVLFNGIEHKNNDSDSLRKWANTQADKTIKILNGNPPSAKYDRETLRILMQLYYARQEV